MDKRAMAQMEALLVSFLMILAPAAAQDVEAGVQAGANSEAEIEGDPGVTPDSFLHGIDVAIDKISLALTFEKSKRAEKALQIARERLLEVKAMAEARKTEHAERAQKLHDEFLASAEKDIEEFEVDDAAGIEKEIEIEKEFEEHKSRVERVSNNLRVKIEIRGDLTPEQKAFLDEMLAKMEGKVGELSIKIDNRKGEIKTKLKERGLEEDEIEKEFEEKEKKHGLWEAREEAAARRIEHAKMAVENVEMAYKGFLVAREIKENVELVDEDADFRAMIEEKTKEFESNGGKIDFSKVNEEEVKSKITEAKDKLAKAEEAFGEEKFGEAFGQATSSMHLSMNAMRFISRAFHGFEFEGTEGLEIRVDMKCRGGAGEDASMRERIKPFIEGEETKERLEKEMHEREELEKREALKRLEAEKLAGRAISFQDTKEGSGTEVKETTTIDNALSESLEKERLEAELKDRLAAEEGKLREKMEAELREREQKFRNEAEKRMAELREKQELRAREHLKAECVAFIRVRAGGGVTEFQLATDDPEAIITEISARTGIPRERVAAALHYSGKMPSMEGRAMAKARVGTSNRGASADVAVSANTE